MGTSTLGGSEVRPLPAEIEVVRATWREIRPGARDVSALKRLHRELQTCLLAPATMDRPRLEEQIRSIQAEVKSLLLDPGSIAADRHARISQEFARLGTAAEPAPEPPPTPVAEAPPDRAPAPVEGPATSRLFLVEDDGHLAQVLPIALKRYGYQVESFGRLEPMLEALEIETPAAIVVDIALSMPGASGPEAVERIRRMLQTPVPIFFLSTRRDLATRLEAMRSGAEVYFANALDLRGLGRKLEAATKPPVDDPYRVLIAVDDFGLALRHSLNLEGAGFKAEAIADPAEVLPALRDFAPDVLVLDLSEAGCTGSELAAVVRQDEECLDVPIVILSSDETELRRAGGGIGDVVLDRDVADGALAAAIGARAKRRRVARAASPQPDEARVEEAAAGPSPVEYVKQTRRLQAIELELAKARDKQRQMLPSVPQLEGYSFRALYEPCSEISGDFYDFIDLGEGKVGITIGDVTGHGVTAALLMAMSKKVIHLVARASESPAEVLVKANREICGEVDRTTFVTLFYGVLDSRAGTFRFARAGHEPLLAYNPAREVPLATYQPAGMAIGLQAGRLFESTLQEVELPVVAGDLFFLYTDGLVEATDAAGQEFGRERLEETILSQSRWVPDALVEHLYAKVTSLRPGRSLADDLTLVAFRYA